MVFFSLMREKDAKDAVQDIFMWKLLEGVMDFSESRPTETEMLIRSISGRTGSREVIICRTWSLWTR